MKLLEGINAGNYNLQTEVISLLEDAMLRNVYSILEGFRNKMMIISSF